MNEYGTASDTDGHKVGEVGEDGTVIDSFGRKIGAVGEDGTITDNHEGELGNVSIADYDPLYLAGGAALLLLLNPNRR